MDYCNSALAGVSKVYLQKLQSVQNTAARMVSGVRRCEHITSVLEDLHWLPISQRREWSSRQRCWSGSVFAVSLQSTSETSAFPLHSSKAASVCNLPLVELYWFHALRQPLGSGVSPSTDLPSGTVATSTTFARTVAEPLQAGTEDASLLIRPATLSRFRDFAAAYKSADLLTYLLICSVRGRWQV